MLIKGGETNWKYILFILILVVIVGGGILGYQYFWLPKEEVKIPEVKILEEVAKDATADWKVFFHPYYNFQIKFPPDWFTISSFDSPFCVLPGEVRSILFCPPRSLSFGGLFLTFPYWRRILKQ